MPSPLTIETGRTSAPARPVSSSVCAISAVTASRRSIRNEIDLGQRHNAATDTEQIDDGKMLAGLRHDAIVGRDDQQDEIDTAGTGQHVVDEFLVAGHVDEPKHSAVRRRQIGEAEVDGDAARLFFLEAIGVDRR